MKLGFWYSDMIRFMEDASEYGNYYEQLVQKMLPHLSRDAHICDAGSGIGYLSLALSPYVRQVTAVEKHLDAAAVLVRNCSSRKITNVISRCGSIDETAPTEPYNAMVFCFFGGSRQILNLAKQQCSGDVFVFTRNYTRHRFSAGNLPSGWEGYPELRALLEAWKIPFRQETFSLEFGQPFRNPSDAKLFFQLYSKDPDKSLLTDDFLQGKLQETGRDDFPLYLPQEKQLAFLHFSVKDIPEDFE